MKSKEEDQGISMENIRNDIVSLKPLNNEQQIALRDLTEEFKKPLSDAIVKRAIKRSKALSNTTAS